MFFISVHRYPNTVNEGYIQYQFYDSIQGLCSYLRGVVSTSAVLTAAGVGDSEATAMGAAVVSTSIFFVDALMLYTILNVIVHSLQLSTFYDLRFTHHLKITPIRPKIKKICSIGQPKMVVG